MAFVAPARGTRPRRIQFWSSAPGTTRARPTRGAAGTNTLKSAVLLTHDGYSHTSDQDRSACIQRDVLWGRVAGPAACVNSPGGSRRYR